MQNFVLLVTIFLVVNFFPACATMQTAVLEETEVNWAVLDIGTPEGLDSLLTLELDNSVKQTGSKTFPFQRGSGEYSYITAEFSGGYIAYRQQEGQFEYIRLSGEVVEVAEYKGEEYAITWSMIAGSVEGGGYFEIHNLTTAEKLTSEEVLSSAGCPEFVSYKEGSPLFLRAFAMIPADYTTFYNLRGEKIGSYSGSFSLIGPQTALSKESDFISGYERIITVDLLSGVSGLDIRSLEK